MVYVAEKFESRSAQLGASSRRELIATVHGTADEDVALTYFNAWAPATWYNLTKQAVELDRGGETWWLGRAEYGPKKLPEVGQSSYTFDTAGGSAHITQSLEVTDSDAVDGVPDHFNVIGGSADGVDGLDIQVPALEWTENHQLAPDAVTHAYVRFLARMTGRTNDDTFRGYEAGEVLFRGAQGNKRGEELWTVNYHFAASENRDGLEIGDLRVNKPGWGYLDVRYEWTEDAAAKILVPKPIVALVHRVHYEFDFSTLGIGTAP